MKLFGVSTRPTSKYSTLWFTPVANVRTLRMHDLKMIRKMYEQQSRGVATDRALFTLDLDADLTGVWNWNVKQLFVYITADFSTASNVRLSEWPFKVGLKPLFLRLIAATQRARRVGFHCDLG